MVQEMAQDLAPAAVADQELVAEVDPALEAEVDLAQVQDQDQDQDQELARAPAQDQARALVQVQVQDRAQALVQDQDQDRVQAQAQDLEITKHGIATATPFPSTAHTPIAPNQQSSASNPS